MDTGSLKQFLFWRGSFVMQLKLIFIYPLYYSFAFIFLYKSIKAPQKDLILIFVEYAKTFELVATCI